MDKRPSTSSGSMREALGRGTMTWSSWIWICPSKMDMMPARPSSTTMPPSTLTSRHRNKAVETGKSRWCSTWKYNLFNRHCRTRDGSRMSSSFIMHIYKVWNKKMTREAKYRYNRAASTTNQSKLRARRYSSFSEGCTEMWSFGPFPTSRVHGFSPTPHSQGPCV